MQVSVVKAFERISNRKHKLFQSNGSQMAIHSLFLTNCDSKDFARPAWLVTILLRISAFLPSVAFGGCGRSRDRRCAWPDDKNQGRCRGKAAHAPLRGSSCPLASHANKDRP